MGDRPFPVSRTVGYSFDKGEFDEEAMERLLADAQKRGIVREYDTGRGLIVWFNGKPGEEIRALRKRVSALIDRGIVYSEKNGWVAGPVPNGGKHG